ncbi:MAG: hypothetical protein R3F62_00270 [Planctomycetota bacterium]
MIRLVALLGILTLLASPQVRADPPPAPETLEVTLPDGTRALYRLERLEAPHAGLEQRLGTEPVPPKPAPRTLPSLGASAADLEELAEVDERLGMLRPWIEAHAQSALELAAAGPTPGGAQARVLGVRLAVALARIDEARGLLRRRIELAGGSRRTVGLATWLAGRQRALRAALDALRRPAPTSR